MVEWKLQIRDEKGKSHAVTLEQGSSTTIRQLKQVVNKVSKVPQYKQVWKTGFPPKVVFSPLTELPKTADISSFLADRDLLVVEASTAQELAEAVARATAEDEAQPADATGQPAEPSAAPAQPALATPAARTAAAATPLSQTPVAAPSSTSAADQQPVLRTSGAAAGTPAPAPPEANGPKPKKRRKANAFPGLARTLDGGEASAPKDEHQAMRQAEDGVLGALLQAARGGAALGNVLGSDWTPGNKSLFKTLRGDLRNARAALDSEQIATEKVAAARAGQVTFRDLTDGSGRMEAVWNVGRHTRRECVPTIPPFLLAAVLQSLHGDADETVARNLNPRGMAQVSPRTFWALVRHGGVSESTTFEDALKKIVPDVDWSVLKVDARARNKPARLRD